MLGRCQFSVLVAILALAAICDAISCAAPVTLDYSMYSPTNTSIDTIYITRVDSTTCTLRVLLPVGTIFSANQSIVLDTGDSLTYYDTANLTASTPVLARFYRHSNPQRGRIVSTTNGVTLVLAMAPFINSTITHNISIGWTNSNLTFCSGQRTINLIAGASSNISEPTNQLLDASYSPYGGSCSYLVVAPTLQHVVQIDYVAVSLQLPDAVVIYDGPSATTSPVLGTALSGTGLGALSTASSVLIVFRFNPGTKVGYTGFQLRLSTYVRPVFCSGQQVIDATTSTTLQMPNPFVPNSHTGGYATNTTCTFLIQAPTGMSIRGSMASMMLGTNSNDIVAAYDGASMSAPRLFSGHVLDPVAMTVWSRSNNLLVVFASGVRYGGGQGFRFDFSVSPAMQSCAPVQVVTGNATIGNTITAAALGMRLPHVGNLRCVFNITVAPGMRIELTTRSVDFLDGDWLSAVEPTTSTPLFNFTSSASDAFNHYSSSNSVTVVYQASANSGALVAGFVVDVRVFSTPAPCSGLTLVTSANLTVPGPIAPGSTCQWLFTDANLFSFNGLNLRQRDRLIIFNGNTTSVETIGDFSGVIPEQQDIFSPRGLTGGVLVMLTTAAVTTGGRYAEGFTLIAEAQTDRYYLQPCVPHTDTTVYPEQCALRDTESNCITTKAPFRNRQCSWTITGTIIQEIEAFINIYYPVDDLVSPTGLSPGTSFVVYDGSDNSSSPIVVCPGPSCTAQVIPVNKIAYVVLTTGSITFPKDAVHWAACSDAEAPATCRSLPSGGLFGGEMLLGASSEINYMWSTGDQTVRPTPGTWCFWRNNATIVKSTSINLFHVIGAPGYSATSMDMPAGSSLVLYRGSDRRAPVLRNYTYPNPMPVLGESFFGGYGEPFMLEYNVTNSPRDTLGWGFQFTHQRIDGVSFCAPVTTSEIFDASGQRNFVSSSLIGGRYVLMPFQICDFVVTSPSGTVLVIHTSSQINLRPVDTVYVYDGNDPSAPLLFRGTGADGFIINTNSRSNVMYVRVVAGEGTPNVPVFEAGFNIAVQSQPPPSMCAGQTLDPRYRNGIRVPHTTVNGLDPGLNCTFTFPTPVGYIRSIQIDGGIVAKGDSLRIFVAGQLVAMFSGAFSYLLIPPFGDVDIVLSTTSLASSDGQRTYACFSHGFVYNIYDAYVDTARRAWGIDSSAIGVCGMPLAFPLNTAQLSITNVTYDYYRDCTAFVSQTLLATTNMNYVFPRLLSAGVMNPCAKIGDLRLPVLSVAFDLRTSPGPTYLIQGILSAPVLKYVIDELTLDGPLLSISMPSLEYAESLNMKTRLFGIASIFLPKLWVSGAISISSPPDLVEIHFPRLQVATQLSVIGLKIEVLEVASPISVLDTTLQFTSLTQLNMNLTDNYQMTLNGNTRLRSVVLPSIFGGDVNIVDNYVLSTLSMPVYTSSYCGAFELTRSAMQELSLPSYQGGSLLTLTENTALASVLLPNMISSETTISVTGSRLQTLSLPNLRRFRTILLDTNVYLTTLDICNAQCGTQVELTTCPQLSCADTQAMFGGLFGILITGAFPNCAETSGVFGCARDVLLEVNTTKCGFSVACIQASLDAAITNHGFTVYIPAGVYKNCTRPLNILGKVITVFGDPAGTTVIDCENNGRALDMTGTETRDTVIRDISFMNGRAAEGGLAIITNGASPTLERCSFTQAVATTGNGGAILISSAASPLLLDIHITAGSSLLGSGGGIEVNGAAVTIQGGRITGCTAAEEGGALAVQGASSVSIDLHGVYVTLSRATRGGGIFTDSPLTLTSCVLTSNTAAQFGGGLAAIALEAVGEWFNVSDTIITDNAARGGAGIFGFSANFRLDNVTLAGNVAADRGGGGLYVTCNQNYRIFYNLIGPCTVYLEVAGSTVFNNTALGNGGGVLAADVIVDMTDSMIGSNSAISGAGVYATVTSIHASTATLSNNVASSYGGALFCEPFTGTCLVDTSTFSDNAAGVAGGAIYLCTAACPNATLGDADYGALALPPQLGLNAFSGNDAAAGSGGYGNDLATDPSRLTWQNPPTTTAISGRTMRNNSLTVAVTDGYGQPVTSSATVLTLSLDLLLGDGESAMEMVTLGGTQSALANSGIATFDGVILTAANTSYLYKTYALRCRLSEISSVELRADVLLLPCGAGEGRAQGTPANAPVTCDDCQAGYYGTGAPDFYCVACPAGSYAPTSLSTVCLACPVNTHAPVTGSGTCLACPDGYSAASEGSVDCTQSAALTTGLSSSAVTGTVVGVVVGLLICISIIGCLIYRCVRRRTMQKYYLDNDATVRTGTQETPLQKDVKKLLLAASTTRIGGGLYSNVYKAKYENRWIALKVIKGEMATNGTAQQEFRREAVALSRLEDRRHPGIIQLSFFLSFNPMCIGVVFYTGGSLKRALANEMFSKPEEKVQVAAEVASGMTVLHALNIVHLDIKTDNMLLTHDNHVVIADFGIARMLGTDEVPDLEITEYIGAGAANAGSTGSNRSGSLNAGSIDGGGLSASNNNNGIMSRDGGVAMTRAGMSRAGSSASSAANTPVRVRRTTEAHDTAFTPQYVDPLRILFDKNGDEDYLKTADVFSYGIMMWAIYQQEEPYLGDLPDVLVEKLRANPLLRPRALTGCPSFYDELMKRCWHETPGRRPTFLEVFETLTRNLEASYGVVLPDGYAHPRNDPGVAPASASFAPGGGRVSGVGGADRLQSMATMVGGDFTGGVEYAYGGGGGGAGGGILDSTAPALPPR